MPLSETMFTWFTVVCGEVNVLLQFWSRSWTGAAAVTPTKLSAPV